jgi:pimeloyl-ACP methyl ester carboxylesterase
MQVEHTIGEPVLLRFAGDGLALVADQLGDPADSAVVLLHGGGQTRHAWGGAAEALARDGRCAVSVDLRGHGDSDWANDGDYRIDTFAADVRAIASTFTRLPVLVGASLGGIASLVAIGESQLPVATALVLVDVAPTVEPQGRARIEGFMRSGAAGFACLEDAADAITKFIPERPRPSDLSGIKKNLRLHDDGRWHWHWDPRFLDATDGIDGQGGFVDHDRLAAAAARVDIPTLLVRGALSDIVSDDGVRELQQLVPHAEVFEVAHAGHMVAGDRNDIFNEGVIDFVDRVVVR